MTVSAETFGGVANLKATPLEKIVLLAMMVETPPGESRWAFTKHSIELAGCSKKSFHSALKSLQDRGVVRKLGTNAYTAKINAFKAPVNYNYLKGIFPLKMRFKEKLLLIAISSFIHRSKDYCWPSQNRLQKMVNMSDWVLKNVLTKLIEEGLLVIKDQDGKTVLQVPNEVVEVYPSIEGITLNSSKFDGISASNKNLSVKITVFDELKKLKTPGNKGSQQDGGVPNIFKNIFKNIYEHRQSTFAGEDMIPKAVSAKETLGLIAGKKKEPKGKPGKILAGIWKSTLPEVCDVCKMNELHLTQKQQGQLNMLAKRLGNDSAEKFKICLLEWVDMVYYIETMAGLKKVPKIPNIGFLLANVLYVNMYFQADVAKQGHEQPATPVVQDAPHKLDGDAWEKKKAEWAKQMEE